MGEKITTLMVVTKIETSGENRQERLDLPRIFFYIAFLGRRRARRHYYIPRSAILDCDVDL